jgi:protein-ribulosamine 3-kinase
MESGELKGILAKRLSVGVASIELRRVGGGCINDCYRVKSEKTAFFCKANSATKFPQLLLKEKNGLELLKKQSVIGVPAVIDFFEEAGMQFLILEWIEQGTRNEDFWKRFGEQLAALHSRSSDTFGLEEDNFMGSISQSNTQNGEWSSFFIEQRLKPLVKKSVGQQLLTAKHIKLFEKVYERIPELFNDNQKPALVHGDLWSGNFICNAQSLPVLVDPAVYYGHPSVDLGMSTLFGGFDHLFYESYNYHRPFPSHFNEQWKVSNLYPLLIHLILFGKGYIQQVEETLGMV